METEIKQESDGFRIVESSVRLDKPILEYFPKDEHMEILGQRLDGTFKSMEAFNKYIKDLQNLKEENELYKHRLKVANEYIETRIGNMIPEHYDDLHYILNECDLESTW